MALNPAVLAAMKAKSAMMQAGALSPASASVTARQPTIPAKSAPKGFPKPIEVNIERVVSHNRLDLRFSRKPAESILAKVHAQGFQWNGEDQRWYHKDSGDNRAFLSREFGADFGEIEVPVPDPVDVTPPPVPVPAGGIPDSGPAVPVVSLQAQSAEPSPIAPLPEVKAEDVDRWEFEREIKPSIDVFERYRNQVDELVLNLRMRPADIIIEAIDCLHKHTFGRN